MDFYDVAIIGGGPAGSTAATLLSRAGRKVIVLEKDRFPRFQIGESLLPFSMGALRRLGVENKLEAAGFYPKHGARISAGGGGRDIRFFFSKAFRSTETSAYQVQRAEFDHLLLEHAGEEGAEVCYEAKVLDVDFFEEGVTLRVFCDGAERTVRAGFLLDCSGRASLVGAKFDLKKRYPALRKFAVYSHYDGVVVPPGPDGSLTHMVREENRWFWMIPLSTSKMSVGLVMDLEEFRSQSLGPEELLDEAVRRQPIVRDELAGGKRCTKVYATSDYSFRNRRFAGRRWLLAGDAAGFIDPVFSSGVFLAILSGESAADALEEAMKKPARGRVVFRRYEKRLHRVMNLYQEFVEGWYRREFIETVLNPQEFFKIVPAVNAVLAGNPGTDFSIRWRIALFRCIVALQKYVPLSPRVNLRPTIS